MLAEKLPERYLILVDPVKNNNKFYKMIDCGDGQWMAQYGRVGNPTVQKRTYPDHVYQTKLREKLAKGYKDVTELHMIPETPKETYSFADITDTKVAEFINRLMMFAKQTIRSNYTVSASDVTQKMVDEARSVIQCLKKTLDSNLPEQTLVNEFNDLVTKLMHVIPRRITGTGESGVKRMLASKKEDCASIILREEDLLDIMESQVAIKDQKVEKIDSSKTLLDVMGIEMYTATAAQVDEVKKHLNPSLIPKLRAVYRVINTKTQKQFNDYLQACKDEDGKTPKVKMLWHGSRNANWMSILQKGLLLKPDAIITGKMFGNGVYFAPSAGKSWGYTSAGKWTGESANTAIMSLYATAYGVPYEVYSHSNSWSGYDFKRLKAEHPDCNCVHAKADKGMLLNDEIIFYREDQMTIAYICEFDI